MKVVNKTILAVAIAAVTAGAQAATVNFPSTATPFQKTIVNEAVRTVVSPGAAGTIVTLAAGESLNVDDSITFTLNNGATWAAIAQGDLTLAPNVNTANVALVSGGAGQNFATYRITDNSTDVAAALTLANTATINAGSVADNGSITMTVTMSGFVGGVATDLFGSPLTHNSVTLAPMMTAAVTSTTGTFDVATGFQQLTAGTSTDVVAPFDDSTTAAVNVTTNANATAGSVTAGVPAANVTAGSTLFTVTGPMSGVDAISDTAAGGLITSSTSAGGVPTGGSVANNFFIDTANNVAYAIGAGAHGTAGATDALTLGFNFATNVGHDVSDYSIAITRLLDGGYSATSVGGGDLASFGRNGSAFTSNSIGNLNRVSISDRSGSIGGTGADGAISITAYDVDGNQVTCTGLTIANLPNNGTVVVPGSDIQTACPGAKRIEGTVNSNSILVTNVKTTSDGATATPAVAVGGGTAVN